MFWIVNELIQREYDSLFFFFLFPIFGLVIIDLLFKNVKEARQGLLFYFWEKTRVAWLSSKPNTNVSLNTYFQFLNNIIHISTHFFTHTYFQKIQTTLLEQYYQMGPIVIILRCGPLMPLYLPIELLFGCCQLAIAIGFVSAF